MRLFYVFVLLHLGLQNIEGTIEKHSGNANEALFVGNNNKDNVNDSATMIDCRDKNADCYIECTSTMQCSYKTIHCDNGPDYICNVNCIGEQSCYYAVIISDSYNFSLSCQSSSSCYGIGVTANFDAADHNDNNRTSTVSVDCGANGTSNDCSNSLFYLSNIDMVSINCLGSNGCRYGRFIISDSKIVDVNCNGKYSCYSTNMNIGTLYSDLSSIEILCNNSYACNHMYINANNYNVETNVICDASYSCLYTNLACYNNKKYSCNLSCNDANSCEQIYFDIQVNNYTKNFITFNHEEDVPENNYVYINCYSPLTNAIIQTTELVVIDGRFECNNSICCPFQQPILNEIICEADSHCIAVCDHNQNYTGCSIVNASKALSLSLQCNNCVSAQIICPINESVCNITCNGGDSTATGCLDAFIDAVDTKQMNLQCNGNDGDYMCQYSRMSLKNNKSNVSLQCLGPGSCSNMDIQASMVQHITLNCVDCSSLNIDVPYLSGSTDVLCLKHNACNSVTLNVYGIYEFQFAEINCNDSYCGKMKFVCYSNESNTDHIYSYMTSTKTCSNYKCCPLTHKHIKCKDMDNVYNDSNDTQCVLNCGGDYYYKQGNDVILCESQYIYGANQINCDGSNACRAMTAFCPQNNCDINCKGNNGNNYTCHNAVIHSNSAKKSNINCFENSCQYMQILINDTTRTDHWTLNCKGRYSCKYMTFMANFSDEVEINCLGDGTCDYMYIDVSNGGIVNMHSEPSQSSYYSLSYTTINATNADQLALDCMGIFGQNACQYLYIYIPQNTQIQCNGTACTQGITLYSNTSTITNQILNVSYNGCQTCDLSSYTSICQMVWRMHCGTDYSNYSSFSGQNCSNKNCCRKNIFSLENNYDECVVEFWKDYITTDWLFYYGLIISILSLCSFIFMIFKFISHRRMVRRCISYHLPFNPPLFILQYIHMIDFIIQITIIYILCCFAVGRNDLYPYCSTKYPVPYTDYYYDDTASKITDLCNADKHCDMLGYGSCHINSPFNGLSITFYVFFGIYFALHLWLTFIMGFGDNKYDSESCFCRILQISNPIKWRDRIIRDFNAIRSLSFSQWKERTAYKYVFFVILFTLAIFANIYTEFYSNCQYFALYPVSFLFIFTCQPLKLYYRSLSPYYETYIIQFIIFERFGYDIGTVLFSYLDFTWSRKTFVSSETKTSKLLAKKYSINM